jgi:prevent-host-death family protein
MAKAREKGAEEARNQLPQLLEDAASGRATVITRRGRPVAALVPLEAYHGSSKQRSLLDLEGSGRGLWGRNSRDTLTKLRDEWNR